MKEKLRNYQDIIYIICMLVYPFTRINQGLSVIDTTYGMSNYLFFDSMKGTWLVATYLANVCGYLLMQLPYGKTMLGMNFYTSFFVSAMAIATYMVLKRIFPKWLVFVSQMIALGLCWAPTTVLYHYLTYMVLQLAILMIFQALTKEEEKKPRRFLVAGLLLGMNVAVRMPNVSQAMLIIAVWYGTILYGDQEARKWRACLQNTLWCLGGYIVGMVTPLLAIWSRYGWEAYPNMVRTMFAMTEKAQDYKPTSMLTGMFGAYFKGLAWLFPWLLVLLVGLLFEKKGWLKGQNWEHQKYYLAIHKGLGVIYLLPFVVLIRLYWGRGMFDFHYENYRSVYPWAVLVMVICVGICGITLVSGEKDYKLLAGLTLLQMFLVPLGGNNELYPVMNVMFMVMPMTLGMLYRWYTNQKIGYYTCVPLVLLCLVLAVQSVGFHFGFALQDGIWGAPRDYRVQKDCLEKAAGMYTTTENGQTLTQLVDFAKEQQLQGKEVILYGQIPGLGYFLDMPSAITTFWPDLDSYRLVEFERDMTLLQDKMEMKGKEAPVVIVSNKVATYLEQTGEEQTLAPGEVEKYAKDAKLERIGEFMSINQYVKTFANASYAVYEMQ